LPGAPAPRLIPAKEAIPLEHFFKDSHPATGGSFFDTLFHTPTETLLMIQVIPSHLPFMRSTRARLRGLWLPAGLAMILPSLTAEEVTVLDEVDPFIGTGFHGHTFPGPTTPFGMVQLSPDTRTSGWDACGGYYDDDTEIWGFSHTHLSGTGIGDYGDVLVMPFSGEVDIGSGTPFKEAERTLHH